MVSTVQHHETRIPYTSGTIARPRLLDKLQAIQAHRLILICAPPGYGKTVVAAQFARESPYPVAWHTVEEQERDVPILYQHCLAALEPVVPGIQTLKAERTSSPGELAATVADYLSQNLAQDIIYILDDAHHLARFPAAETWLRTLVGLLPPRCHMIMLSRILPDVPLTEMIARREVLAIGQEQLRFTPEEIAHLAHETGDRVPSHAEVHDLAVRLEGWPAGTVLALHPLPRDLEHAMLSGGAGPEALFEALAGWLLDSQTTELRDFLLASSTFARVAPELCVKVLRMPDSAYWLAEAQRRNLFLSRIAGGLVYHKLFREFLQHRLKARDPALFVRLHEDAGRWFEEHNRIDEALDHYLTVGRTRRAADLADRVTRVYFSQGKVETLLNWRVRLGADGVHAPRLLYTCAVIRADRYEYAIAETELTEAERGYRLRKDEIGVAEVQIQRATINLQQGEYRSAASQVTLLAQIPPGPANLRGRALKVLGVASLRLGEARVAVRQLEEALPLHQASGDDYTLANVLQDLAVAYSRLGRLNEASGCLQQVVALRRSLGGAGALATALNNLGFYYHRGGDYKQAMLTFQEGLSVIARIPSTRPESYLLASMGDLQRDRGAFDEALRLYTKALELVGSTEPSLRCALLVGLATLRRWQGDLHGAVVRAEEASALATAHSIALEDATARAALWAARAGLGEVGEALAHLEAVTADLRRQTAQYELVWVLALCAHVALLDADNQAATRYLRSAARAAQQVGSAQPLIAEIVHTPLLQSLVDDCPAVSGALLADLERLRAAQVKTFRSQQASSRTGAGTAYTLRVLTLGQEGIERDGTPVAFNEWRSTAARELFLYLLFAGPESRERISLVFWPDKSSKRVRSNFHTTLYRARHALGENVLTFHDGLYLVNPDVDVWCDAHELVTLVQQARPMPPRDARTEDLWRKAVELYQGDFLPSLETEWVIYRRESLREVCLEALIGLGECARARGAIREAIAIYKRALGTDPYREDVHRAILSCYADLGENNQILTHLRKLRDLLREDLAIEPSSETLALAETLLG